MNRRLALAGLAAYAAAPTAFALDWFSTPTPKVDTDKLRRFATHTVMLCDVSYSSPIFAEGFRRSIWPVIEQHLIGLQIGDLVSVALVGDPMKKDGGMQRLRLQKRANSDGGDAATIARRVRGLLAGLTEGNAGQNESALVAALRDASGLFNPEATRPQTLIYVTDGVERSWAHEQDGQKSKSGTQRYIVDCLSGGCDLGAPRFKVPKGTRCVMLGIGLGVESDQQQSIKTGWANLLRKAGFADIQLLTRI